MREKVLVGLNMDPETLLRYERAAQALGITPAAYIDRLLRCGERTVQLVEGRKAAKKNIPPASVRRSRM